MTAQEAAPRVPKTPRSVGEAPAPIRIRRGLPPKSYRLLEVFPGFLDVPPFAEYPVNPRRRRSLAEGTAIQVVAERGWMYVAPLEPPPWAATVGWTPFTSPTDCIVVSKRHLDRSPAITLYLDLLHEFYHILQRDAGRELWDISRGYVDSPTEVEAYRFSVAEARRLGLSDAFLRKYLSVEWVSAKDHRRLLKNLAVPPARR